MSSVPESRYFGIAKVKDGRIGNDYVRPLTWSGEETLKFLQILDSFGVLFVDVSFREK